MTETIPPDAAFIRIRGNFADRLPVPFSGAGDSGN